MKRYSLGFLFSQDLVRVLLIMKTHGPNDMTGKLNGLGGEARDDERLIDAMAREFEEEAGVKIPAERWTRFADLDGGYGAGGYTIGLFYAAGPEIDATITCTDEELHRVYTDAGSIGAAALHSAAGVKWMVQMALAHARGEDKALYSCHRSTVLFA